MSQTSPQRIIAIGASAGGLEEINAFFDHTPCDGVSYIIVQHLSSDFKSRMVELLARHSKLEVMQAEEGMPVISNKVYLIPHDKAMIIENDCLYLKEKNIGPNLTINTFFNSLAKNSGKKAVAIILSGLGSDGTIGIESIKNAGGIVIARDPFTTQFGSMPSSAIATGKVDFVVEPEFMPEIIDDFVKQEGLSLQEIKENGRIIEEITTYIKENSVLDFTDYKPATILRRIKRRAAATNFKKLDKYLVFLKDTPAEVETLTQQFLISVTAFFRDLEAYQALEDIVIPDLLNRLQPGEELRLWVAGCATGEEAFSLAILVKEQLTGKFENTEVKIFATDIDGIALLQAAKGTYPASAIKTVSAQRLKTYFIEDLKQFRVVPEIRRMVIFARHDLVKNPPYCNMHFISCRNLLIYMAPILQKKIYAMLLFGLKLDGYLFLGSSENPTPIIKNLEVVNNTWKIYKNIEKKRSINFDGFSLPQMAGAKDTSNLSAKKISTKITSHTLEEAISMKLVNEMNSLVICVDSNSQVLKTYGDTSHFLLQKNFTTNLDELLPRPLAVAYNTLCINAKRTKETSSLGGINIKQGELDICVNITVTPLRLKKAEQGILLVIFKEEKINDQAVTVVAYDDKMYFNQYTLLLEEEFKELQEKLQHTYEQLDASNDNMQSYNEELLSSNEEMQSTNEEMQSVNEELHTINAEFQLKNKELQDVNDDLNNYFRSNINGQLFVNSDLLLMKFSPGTVKQINLLPTDIGRPLSNISTNIKFETIENDIKKVIKDGGVITREVETDNGKWYQVMTMPYILTNNKSNGAILTFNDITELKKAQLELDRKNEKLSRINADLDNFVLTATHDLLGPLGNIEMSINVMNKLEVMDPRLSEFMRIIDDSVKKFRTLVNDIGHVAKLESDMTAKEIFNIDEVINNIEWSLGGKIKESGAVLIRNLEIKEILFSKKNFRSILYNLISNGIKHRSEAPPVVTVHSYEENEFVNICVEDNGIGISKDDIETIFKLYRRLNTRVEGNGIGLSLAKKLIDAAGGNILVESQPGIGSKFTICFKIREKS